NPCNKSWKDKIMNQEEILNEHEKAILYMLQSHTKREIAEILNVSFIQYRLISQNLRGWGCGVNLRISLKLR
ncbi:hypothetical protein KID03_08125, partial [bacterium]|nr:hypothetical protein [bacterium]